MRKQFLLSRLYRHVPSVQLLDCPHLDGKPHRGGDNGDGNNGDGDNGDGDNDYIVGGQR